MARQSACMRPAPGGKEQWLTSGLVLPPPSSSLLPALPPSSQGTSSESELSLSLSATFTLGATSCYSELAMCVHTAQTIKHASCILKADVSPPSPPRAPGALREESLGGSPIFLCVWIVCVSRWQPPMLSHSPDLPFATDASKKLPPSIPPPPSPVPPPPSPPPWADSGQIYVRIEA